MSSGTTDESGAARGQGSGATSVGRPKIASQSPEAAVEDQGLGTSPAAAGPRLHLVTSSAEGLPGVASASGLTEHPDGHESGHEGSPRFEIFQDAAGNYLWRLLAGDAPMITSGVCCSKLDAREGIRAVRRAVADAKVHDTTP